MGLLIKGNAVFAEKYKTYPKLARALMEGHEHLFPNAHKSGSTLSRHSVTNYLRNLDKGEETGWWWERKEVTRRLMDLLRLTDAAELGIHPAQKEVSFSFPGFAALPAPNFGSPNATWSIGEVQPDTRASTLPRRAMPRYTLECWLADYPQPFTDRPVDWLQVADEVEYGLLVAKLGAAWRTKPLDWSSVADGMKQDAARLANPAPLVVALSNDASLDEIAMLVTVRQKALLVISHHALPIEAYGRDYAQKGQNAPRRRIVGELIGDALAKISCWRWTVMPHWRSRMLDWIAARMPPKDTQAVDTVEDILSRVDPTETIFTQTRDVLELCGMVHSGKPIDSASLTPENAGLTVLARLPKASNARRQRILRAVVARWGCWDVPWEGPLDESQWALVVGADQLANFKSKELKEISHSRYDFEHPVIARLLIRQELREMLARASVADWAQAVFDAQRRPLLDSTLDQLELADLAAAATCIEADKGADPVLKLAAAEALFVAVGRKIAGRPGESKALHDKAGLLKTPWSGLVARILQSLDFAIPKQPAWSWTRPTDSSVDRLEWITACWAWSMVAKVQDVPPTWLFPGWAGESLSAVGPQWLLDCITSLEEEMAAPPAPAWTNFVEVLARWLESGKTVLKFKSYPATMHIAMIFNERVAPADWSIAWHTILGRRWTEYVVGRWVESLRHKQGNKIAHRWWPALLQQLRLHDIRTSSNRFSAPQRQWSYLASGESELLDWVAKEVSTDAHRAVMALPDEDKEFLTYCPGGLPTSIKEALLTWLAERPEEGFPNLTKIAGPHHAWLQFEYFGEDAASALPGLLSSFAGGTVADLLWRWAPELAVDILRRDAAGDIIGKRNLLWACPQTHLGDAIDTLWQYSGLFTGPERRVWVRTHLPKARAHAVELMALLNEEGLDPARQSEVREGEPAVADH